MSSEDRHAAPTTDDEAAEQESAFMRAVAAGLDDLAAGREVSMEEARKRLGLT